MLIRREDGAGGKYMAEFLKKHIISRFGDNRLGEISLADMDDSSDFDGYVFTTDSYVVSPPIFRGGSIGSLAVCGTANDLAVMGAKPYAMSLALIIQEGFKVSDFEKIMNDVERWVKELDVKLITGDTKVVSANVEIIANTSGIGIRNSALDHNISVVKEYRDYPYNWVRDCGLREGDAIIVSGCVADHAVAIMLSREFDFDIDVQSDVYPVWLFVKEALEVGGITAMKDPTRGGLANALNELAEKSGVGIYIEEERIPIREEVKGFCEVLGLDPLSMANEGKVVMGVVEDMAEDVLKALHKAGQKYAEIIGYATSEFEEVVVETEIGTKKVLPPPTADPIPRVC
ncbi:hydrogenase expression/formation protein HypE [Archaeoglobus profundus]|uniref:Hydrogenase expression/formation protein HypE n=1 Tax=Archaeoglobus profundus (strain DSM 5631 / JCM 9629 / NBRC 100127 / Av18) TaxID=572546 RepID=D2RDT5_ARCPA|nr:hydrogenase expression/formation protein HypE [Archaeoglobus profundus]ADB58279.1 hydrogenase expression/formation protein HypE [Archaeoglobus profundus DSM 5631]